MPVAHQPTSPAAVWLFVAESLRKLPIEAKKGPRMILCGARGTGGRIPKGPLMLVRFRVTRRALSGLPRNLMSPRSTAPGPYVTTRPSAEDGSWSLNFEKPAARKRTSRASKVTHLPHHPTTPTVRPATPAQNHACAPEGGNAGPSCRLVPLGTLGVASRVPVARGTSGESPVALCINRWCRRSHHVRQGAYFASCCDLLQAPVA